MVLSMSRGGDQGLTRLQSDASSVPYDIESVQEMVSTTCRFCWLAASGAAAHKVMS